MKIALGQICPLRGDIESNIDLHVQVIQQAIEHEAGAVFFPELSITGYEPALADNLAVKPDDTRFLAFQQLADSHEITVGIGAPTRSQTGNRISMLIFQPYEVMRVYSKQFIHPDEEPYFEAGEGQLFVSVRDVKIAPAICYESLLDEHVTAAANFNIDIYLASTAKPQKGIEKAMLHYPRIARQFSIIVMLSNSVGFCDNFTSAGQSAVWSKTGQLVGHLDNDTPGILLFDTESGTIFTKTLDDSMLQIE